MGSGCVEPMTNCFGFRTSGQWRDRGELASQEQSALKLDLEPSDLPHGRLQKEVKLPESIECVPMSLQVSVLTTHRNVRTRGRFLKLLAVIDTNQLTWMKGPA